MLVRKALISPPSENISRTKDEEMFANSSDGVIKRVSILGLSRLFIPLSWNSYSKSETALNPLIIICALCSLAKSTSKRIETQYPGITY